MADQSAVEEADHVEILEGKAKIWFSKANSVFYNPVQIFNRDLSIAVINHYSERYWDSKQRHRQKRPFWKSEKPDVIQEEREEDNEELAANPSKDEQQTKSGLDILEALAASGLRSIRYALEISAAGNVIANDLSKEAYQSMIYNIQINGVEHIVHPSCHDASMLMYEHRDPFKRFDVIDIDPYGSPTVFLDSVVQACHEGGLLCITCTDTSILCGNHSETCHAKYGSVSLKTKYCHEMALRIILACLDGFANRYRRYIHPLLSCSVDFYCRVFVTVYTSPAEVKKSASKMSMVYHCSGCGSFYLQPMGKQIKGNNGSVKFTSATGPPVDRKCEHCGYSFKMGGPVWSDPIHDTVFVRSLLESVKMTRDRYTTSERIVGLLTMISEELSDVPLYHVLDELCSTLHCTSLKLSTMRSAILNQGYKVSVSHANANAIKTNAPHNVIWDIMRTWVKDNPVKNVSPSSPAAVILSKEPSLNVSFAVRQDADPLSRAFKLVRFPENPEANWGPKPRAKRKLEKSNDAAKKEKKRKKQ